MILGNEHPHVKNVWIRGLLHGSLCHTATSTMLFSSSSFTLFFLLNFVLFYFGEGREMGGIRRHGVKDTKNIKKKVFKKKKSGRLAEMLQLLESKRHNRVSCCLTPATFVLGAQKDSLSSLFLSQGNVSLQ